MKKQEFLDKLKSRLSILNDEEVDDILNEYEAHINEKLHAGKSEEEATADFGDFNELVKEILGAYKIKDKAPHESRSTGSFEQWIHQAIDEITDFVKPLFDRFSALDTDQIGYFIVYLVLTLVMVWLIQIPFWIIGNMGVWFLNVIPFGLGTVIGFIFSVAMKIAQLVVSILIIVIGIQRAIEAATSKKPVNFGININTKTEKTEAKERPEAQEKPEPKPQPTPAPTPEPAPEPKPIPQPSYESKAVIEPSPKMSVKVENKAKPKKEPVIMPMISTFFILLFKGFVFLCMIPGFMFAFGLMIALGVMIALLFKGIYFIGLFMIIIGFLTATMTVLDMIYKTVFKRGVQHA